MPDLIPFEKRLIGTEELQTVDGRDIHAFLGITKPYNPWIKAQVKRAHLIDNRDYTVYYPQVVNPLGGRPSKEYYLSFDAAKHVAMMSGAAKGREARDYFIQKEKELNALLAQRGTFQGMVLKSYDEIMVMFQQAAVTTQNLRAELDTKVTAEEARAIVKEALQHERNLQGGMTGITPGKITLLDYLDETGQVAHKPQFWQDWMAYYDIASLLESPELVLQAGRRWPWRYYTRETHAKAFTEYLRRDKHEDRYKHE
jgi:anti-repressor protein